MRRLAASLFQARRDGLETPADEGETEPGGVHLLRAQLSSGAPVRHRRTGTCSWSRHAAASAGVERTSDGFPLPSFQLLSAADTSTRDVSRLHDKLDRKIKVAFQKTSTQSVLNISVVSGSCCHARVYLAKAER